MSNTGDSSPSGNCGGQSKRTLRDPQVIAAITTGVLGLAGVLIGIFISNHSSPSPQPTLSRSPSTFSILRQARIQYPPTPPGSSPIQKLNIKVACKIPPGVYSGKRITVTYTITSNQAVKVGLGAGVYDSGGTDHSAGTGDQDGYQLTAGTQTATRIIVLPAGFSADQYEIDAEIWPNGEIGTNGADVLAEATYGSFNVP